MCWLIALKCVAYTHGLLACLVSEMLGMDKANGDGWRLQDGSLRFTYCGVPASQGWATLGLTGKVASRPAL